MLDFDLEVTIDALDAAIAAGLVREVDTGQYIFAYALVRHTVLDDFLAPGSPTSLAYR